MRNFQEDLFYRTPPDDCFCTYHSHTSLEVLETFKAYTTAIDKTLIYKFYVVKGHGGNLLGKESAKLFNLLCVGPPDKVNILSYSEKSKEDIKKYTNHAELQTVSGNYKDVFQGPGKLKNYQLKLHIDESVTSVQQPLRRLPYHTRKKLSKEITRLLENDYIERVERPTSWINPIVVVPK